MEAGARAEGGRDGEVEAVVVEEGECEGCGAVGGRVRGLEEVEGRGVSRGWEWEFVEGEGVVAVVGGGVDEGMKDIARVPEKRTMVTARATGRTAEKGLGQLRTRVISTPMVMTSDRSTSMRACRRPSLSPVVPGPYQKPSSAGMTLQLLKMGNSSPRAISVTRISNPVGLAARVQQKTSVSDVRTAPYLSCISPQLAMVCARGDVNQSRLSGWSALTLFTCLCEDGGDAPARPALPRLS